MEKHPTRLIALLTSCLCPLFAPSLSFEEPSLSNSGDLARDQELSGGIVLFGDEGLLAVITPVLKLWFAIFDPIFVFAAAGLGSNYPTFPAGAGLKYKRQGNLV